MTTVVDESIADRIVHILKIYPKISPSMMQIGIGSSLPTKIWKPVLKDLILREVVKEDILAMESPGGRHQTYTILSLNDQTFSASVSIGGDGAC